MRLPRLLRKRSSLTDQIVTALLAAAEGRTSKAATSAALETAAGLLGRALSTAEVSGEFASAITPAWLHMAGRALVRRGSFVSLIVVNGSEVELRPGVAEISGGDDPEDWTYQLQVAGPTTTRTISGLTAAEVVHLRWAVDPERPWAGIGPLQAAEAAGRLAGGVTDSLAAETVGAVGQLVPLPAQVEMTEQELAQQLVDLDGGVAVVRSTSDGWGDTDGRSAPRGDWETKRFGMDVPQGTVELYAEAHRQALTACGVPPPLWEPSASSAAREAYREYLFTLVAPLARTMAAELGDKLGATSFDFAELRASDVQGRARAFGSMVQGGLPVDEARRFAGLESNDTA